MAAEYLTQPGDMLDAICQAHYGHTDSVTEVLAANPGLAVFGPVLPPRLTVLLPDPPDRRQTPVIRLWGQA
ncbi:tail protein X [Fluviibacterium sp. DFM31]|uniref:Tail protein X n=1 Tax=Meridianimarinicoccus marinus TaxID=3231483 RepID=A0ABV3L6Y4_9RHOB